MLQKKESMMQRHVKNGMMKKTHFEIVKKMHLFFIFKLSISQSTIFRVRYKYRHILNMYVVSFTIMFNYTIKTEHIVYFIFRLNASLVSQIMI